MQGHHHLFKTKGQIHMYELPLHCVDIGIHFRYIHGPIKGYSNIHQSFLQSSTKYIFDRVLYVDIFRGRWVITC